MIEGIRTRDLVRNVDDRGYFAELLRQDWGELLGDDRMEQVNLSYSHPNIVRAWHRHVQGQVDYFLCVKGSVKICAFDDRIDSNTRRELDEVVLSEHRPVVLRIPGILWHGYKVVGSRPAGLLYFVNRLYNAKQPDEERRAWNDLNVVPCSVNGRTDDARVGKPWDWHYPSHR